MVKNVFVALNLTHWLLSHKIKGRPLYDRFNFNVWLKNIILLIFKINFEKLS